MRKKEDVLQMGIDIDVHRIFENRNIDSNFVKKVYELYAKAFEGAKIERKDQWKLRRLYCKFCNKHVDINDMVIKGSTFVHRTCSKKLTVSKCKNDLLTRKRQFFRSLCTI